jgi:hypothetical protein
VRKAQMLFLAVLLGAGLAALSANQAGTTSGALLFDGARLITGGAGTPIESSAFLVENGKFTKVGRKGEIQAPGGATGSDRHSQPPRVDRSEDQSGEQDELYARACR